MEPDGFWIHNHGYLVLMHYQSYSCMQSQFSSCNFSFSVESGGFHELLQPKQDAVDPLARTFSCKIKCVSWWLRQFTYYAIWYMLCFNLSSTTIQTILIEITVVITTNDDQEYQRSVFVVCNQNILGYWNEELLANTCVLATVCLF